MANVKGHAPASSSELSPQPETSPNPPDPNTEREAGCSAPSCSAYIIYEKDGQLEIIERTSRNGETERMDLFCLPFDIIEKVVNDKKIYKKEDDEITEVQKGELGNTYRNWLPPDTRGKRTNTTRN